MLRLAGFCGGGLFFGTAMFLLLPAALQAQTLTESGDHAAQPGTLDCTEISIDYLNDPRLTREERIALMDRALQKSLSQFDACETARTDSAGSADGSGAAGSGAGGASGDTGTAGGQKSLAAQDMTGTEPTPTDVQSREAEQAAIRSEQNSEDQSAAREARDSRPETVRALDNGKIPEDIPPADNDSVLEAQIRQAAINEEDPEIRKRLWNEYRKYKGLPQIM